MSAIRLLIVITLLALILALIFYQPNSKSNIQYGVTFTPEYARYLGLDWQKTYLEVLDDLKVKNLRLPTYWNILQPKEDTYNFSETDFMLSEGFKRGVKIILVLGVRQPRWPECHVPNWANKLTLKERQDKTLEFIQKVVEKYKDNPSIVSWQLENEPFIWWFGEKCDQPDKEFLQSELRLIKDLDNRSIMITDSGEWGLWLDSLKIGDVLGISIYKKAYNQNLHINTPYLFPLQQLQILKTNFFL